MNFSKRSTSCAYASRSDVVLRTLGLLLIHFRAPVNGEPIHSLSSCRPTLSQEIPFYLFINRDHAHSLVRRAAPATNVGRNSASPNVWIDLPTPRRDDNDTHARAYNPRPITPYLQIDENLTSTHMHILIYDQISRLKRIHSTYQSEECR
jgi:hypothetical protein